ncbi:hypothetical protein, conserved [Trypanosoma brucei gambiense DAL972]|uniref:Uncharacterized protein n=2 Tax=Trypanosoma brucei TaxID=5691 RepID=C9ZPU4_TRYB9|nr:hypothetical protein, conserved [Trypanosoma brucei gambiense DAL972]RHW72548.1 hypothetical protein DPX39_050047700 [Trypanosoma brucei equiperdum]CBH11422.1 hypothetical protein, conserved [Trypanosoma brucei gambiense DAL972]|eukprot:XP_011773709.1 hypothetical protein, conserved [Trypanosoma brucei gambiense DAL972]
MFCCFWGLLLAPRRVAVPVDRLRELFLRCGLRNVVENNAAQFGDRAMLQAFMPLFTPHFTIENHHFTMLGDIAIDDFLSTEVLQYAMHAGLVLTANACKQLNAVLHNHFTLRLFAKDLHFDELAVPLGVNDLARDQDDESVGAAKLEFLTAKHVGLRGRDTLGTSFHMTPLRCGQSPLGWVFSHFVGAVHHHLGRDATRELLLHVYGNRLNTGLPNAATRLLLRTLQHFPPMNVAEAILAAQGLQAQFVSRTRSLSAGCCTPRDVGSDSNSNGQGGGGSCNDDDVYVKDGSAANGDVVLCSGFGISNPATDTLTIDELVERGNEGNTSGNVKDILSSIAAGPRGLDAVDMWKQRVEREKKFLQTAGVDDHGGVNDGSGWLPSDEWEQCKRGAASRNSVDFSTVANYFADSYGQKQPVNGQKIARLKFKDPVRDPVFYDTQSDMRNGVPLSTDGEPVSSYLDGLNQPHARLFEVSLVVGGRTAGRAISWRYTSARESACKAFLGAVLHDLQLMRERSCSGNKSDDNDESPHTNV